MLLKSDKERLLDDIKLIAKAVKVMGDENDQKKREYALGLVSDLVNRLYSDMTEIEDKGEIK